MIHTNVAYSDTPAFVFAGFRPRGLIEDEIWRRLSLWSGGGMVIASLKVC